MALQVDRLEPLFRKHGLALRKHTGRFPSWTAREPTVADLDGAERRILDEQGEDALARHLAERGMFTVPALDIRALAELHLRTTLADEQGTTARVFVAEGSPLCGAADALCALCAEHDAPAPEVISGGEFDLLDLRAAHAFILGGAHENEAAALLCDRGWLDSDRRFPGPGGWLLRTVHNPAGLGHNLVHLCADEATLDEALAALSARLTVEDGALGLAPVLEAHPSAEARAWIGDWEGWQRRFAAMAWRGREYEFAPMDDVEAFARWLALCFDCGGTEGDFYNRGPMAAGTLAGRLYLLTGDRRFLELNRLMLLALIDYHCNFPGGASYLADYDFEVHSQILYWDLLEQEDVFSDEERLIITNFLLASVRMCEGYRRERWPVEPGRLRHNHETFPGLTVFMGGRYFSDYYDLPEAREWLDTAELIFTGAIEDRAKHREDANLYQWLVPAHKLVYDALNGLYTYRDNGVLERLAHLVIATTDNLGHPCDFGDAGRPVSGGAQPAALMEIIAAQLGDPAAQWWAERIWDAIPPGAAVRLSGFLGEVFATARVEPARPETPPTLDVVALEDHLRALTAPEFPRPLVYDKIALRDGWEAEGQYLLLDGYSVGSHIHHDQNAIIRYTAAERMWLVDNGYGKQSGVTQAGRAFSGRQIGPQDHNTLLVFGEAEAPLIPPPFCALLTAETAGPLSLVQSALVGYGGVDWLRSIAWITGCGALIVDQVNVVEPVRELRCQLNMLGEVEVGAGLLTCSQAGRTMHLHFERDARVELGAYTNASWEDEFALGTYPYARLPVRKFERVATPGPGSWLRFVTLLEAGDSDTPRLRLGMVGGAMAVGGELPVGEAEIDGVGLALRLSSGILDVAVSRRWPVPDDVPRLPAQSERYALKG